jgi:hypothetical protein
MATKIKVRPSLFKRLVIPQMTGWLEQRARREGIDNHMEIFIEEATDLAAAQRLLEDVRDRKAELEQQEALIGDDMRLWEGLEFLEELLLADYLGDVEVAA